MAVVTIKNLNDFTKIIEARVSKALEMTQKEIFDVVQEHIKNYYHEMVPILYDRTWHLLNSLIKTEVVKTGNTFACSVEIDRDYLNYKYSGGASGLEVMEYADNHSHGGVYDDDFGCVWQDSLAELGLEPGIRYIMKKNLQKCGVPTN